MIIFIGRFANDPSFHRMANASDMAIYIAQARRLLEGTWPTGAFGYQPGNSFWLAGLLLITRDSLYGAVILTILFGSLSTILIAYSTYLLSRSTKAGLLAGLLFALYPVSAFYDTTLLIAPAAAFFASVTLVFVALLYRRPHWGWALGAGLVIGIASYFRTTMVALIPAGVLAIWLVEQYPLGSWFSGWLKKTLLSAVLIAGVVLALAPGIGWNSYHLEEFSLPNTVGPLNLYRGNNRDAGGVNANSQAYYIEHSRGQDWTAAFVDDVKAEPGRWVGLLIRKYSLFWRDAEIPNMFDFYQNGLASAYLLRVSPLGFGLLSFVAIFALVVTIPRPHPIWIPVAYILTYSILTALILVVGRYRIPVIPALAMCAGLGFHALSQSDHKWKQAITGLVGAGLIIYTIVLLGNIFPRPRIVQNGQLPEGYIATDLQFGDDVRLIGYQLESDTFYEDDWVVAKLAWQAIGTPDDDYSAFLHLIEDDGRRIGSKDLVVGTVSHPWTTMTMWQPGQVFLEEVAINIGEARQIPASPTLWIGVYDKQTLTRLPISDNAGSSFDNRAAALGELRVIREQLSPETEPDTPANVVLGNSVTLYGYTLSKEDFQAGTSSELMLYWEVAAPTPFQVSILIHIVDAQGNVVAQADGAPLGGILASTLWREGDQWADTHIVALPPEIEPGKYTLRVGMYDWQSGERLPITESGDFSTPDNTIDLTTITISGASP